MSSGFRWLVWGRYRHARARRRDSTLRKRAATRRIGSPKMPSHRPESKRWPAATARLSCFLTNHDHQTRPSYVQPLQARDNDLLP
jgi:hypothetical protein